MALRRYDCIRSAPTLGFGVDMIDCLTRKLAAAGDGVGWVVCRAARAAAGLVAAGTLSSADRTVDDRALRDGLVRTSAIRLELAILLRSEAGVVRLRLAGDLDELATDEAIVSSLGAPRGWISLVLMTLSSTLCLDSSTSSCR